MTVETEQQPAVTVDRPDDWWKSAVVYQIYPRSFSDSNGDGIGDLPGMHPRLDYLAELGVDVVWLSPVYRSPMDDNGYDISDYQDVDPLFGTLADLDDADRRAARPRHEAGHGPGGQPHLRRAPLVRRVPRPRLAQARLVLVAAGPGGLRRPAPTGAEPTNWESAFSGSAWQYDERSGEYFLHLFSPKQPDLNWENPEVREAVYAMMHWWVDRGVDGFRMDVINLISKQPELLDGEAPPGRTYAAASIRGQRAAAGRVPGRDERRGRADRAQPAHRRGDAGLHHRRWPGG